MTDVVDVPIPALLGRYRPGTVIGRGGMALVFRATDEVLGRDVALKVFRAGAETDFARHEAEIRVLASLSHHGIVTLIDAGIDDSSPLERRPFLVMELVRGEDFERALRHRSFNVREIGEIAYDMAEALEYAHARDIVHRDIKPSNIMLVEYGSSTFRTRARLTDFGIALDATAERLTQELATTGTAAYLSPEQVKREPLTSASDVYALGLVLIQAFTGRLVFPGTAVESALARLDSDPEIPADLPGDWSSILRGMTARDPADRPPIAELTPLFRQEVIAASARHKGEERLAERDDAVSQRQRLEALTMPPDGSFERVSTLAARTLGVPVAIVSIADHDRIWYASRHGFDVQRIVTDPELSSSISVAGGDLPGVDPHRLVDPATARAAGFRFVLSVPLTTHDGHRLGALTVLDVVERTATADELATLMDLAAVVVDDLEVRLAARRAVLGLGGSPPSRAPRRHPAR